MTNQYKNFFKILKENNFLKSYISAISIAILIDWLILAYFTKNMGLYVPITIISIYYIVSELGGYLEHYFHNIKVSKIFKILVILDILQLIIMFTYFYDLKVFTILLMIIFSFQALHYEIYSISILKFIERNEQNNIKISKFQSYIVFNRSNMVLLGLILSLIYSLITDNYNYLIYFIIFLSLFSIYNEINLVKYITKKENKL